MSGTIADWEARRFEHEATTSLEAIETVTVEERIAPVEDDGPTLSVWASRFNSGFYVQGLVDSFGNTMISCGTVNGGETFSVEPKDAADAFEHPYAYGASLPL